MFLFRKKFTVNVYVQKVCPENYPPARTHTCTYTSKRREWGGETPENLGQHILGLSLTWTEVLMHPNFDPAGVQTHYLQIMDSTIHVPNKTLALTTEPSGTLYFGASPCTTT